MLRVYSCFQVGSGEPFGMLGIKLPSVLLLCSQDVRIFSTVDRHWTISSLILVTCFFLQLQVIFNVTFDVDSDASLGKLFSLKANVSR